MLSMKFSDMMMNNHLYQANYNYEEGWGYPVEERDDLFLYEICDYFFNRMEKEHVTNGSADSPTWAPLVQRHKKIIDALMDRDIEYLHEVLRNICKSPLTLGTCGGDIIEAHYARNTGERRMFVFGVFDKLVSVAQAAGVVHAFNPEDYSYEEVMMKKPEFFLDLIAKKYQFDISAPAYAGGNLGIETEYGVYSQRDMFGLHLALMVADRYPDRGINICDIGGGLGHLTYYLHRLGYRNLTIVDLPTISVSQMYFLGTNLSRFNSVKFISPDEFTGNYDVVINADSFIEMSKESAARYLDLIDKNGKHLISMNQETGPIQFENGFRVCDITTMKRTCRFMSWVRKGWVYEEYKASVVKR
jgi:2-polyprenyl-3-methyl-5-hydroxy-6-metoxy-1,4-benzoquinol methylase